MSIESSDIRGHH